MNISEGGDHPYQDSFIIFIILFFQLKTNNSHDRDLIFGFPKINDSHFLVGAIYFLSFVIIHSCQYLFSIFHIHIQISIRSRWVVLILTFEITFNINTYIRLKLWK